MEKQKFLSLDKSATNFLKGLAILFVILGHMGYIYKGGSWGVSLFLMISGYGVFQSYIKNDTKYFFRKRIIKVYIPFLIVMIFIVLYNIFRYRLRLHSIVLSLLGLDFGYICDKTMWFISFIFCQYTIFYLSTLSFKTVKNDNIKHILIISLTIIYNTILYKFDYLYMIFGRDAGVFLYIYSFSIGLLLSKLSSLNIDSKKRTIILSLISFVLLVIVAMLMNNIYSNKQYAIYANTLPLLLIALINLEIIKTDNKFINYIGTISYDLYLWEGFFLKLRFNLFSKIGIIVLIDIITILLCIFFSQVYKKLLINPIVSFAQEKLLPNKKDCK